MHKVSDQKHKVTPSCSYVTDKVYFQDQCVSHNRSYSFIFAHTILIVERKSPAYTRLYQWKHFLADDNLRGHILGTIDLRV